MIDNRAGLLWGNRTMKTIVHRDEEGVLLHMEKPVSILAELTPEGVKLLDKIFLPKHKDVGEGRGDAAEYLHIPQLDARTGMYRFEGVRQLNRLAEEAKRQGIKAFKKPRYWGSLEPLRPIN